MNDIGTETEGFNVPKWGQDCSDLVPICFRKGTVFNEVRKEAFRNEIGTFCKHIGTKPDLNIKMGTGTDPRTFRSVRRNMSCHSLQGFRSGSADGLLLNQHRGSESESKLHTAYL